MISVERAVEVFAKGFAYTKSFTHPYELDRLGPMWLMRDAPRRRGPYRIEEIVSYGVSPEETMAHIRGRRPQRYALCAIHTPDEDGDARRDAFKAAGLRLHGRETFMVRELTGERATDGPFPVRRVLTQADADAVTAGAGRRQILAEHLRDDSTLRLYAAWDGDNAVGWVRSVQVVPDASWVSNMYVPNAYRRKGIARSLMTAMLVDDQRHGVRHSVLIASNAGAQLYRVLGYEQIGTIQLFMPRTAKRVSAPDNAA